MILIALSLACPATLAPQVADLAELHRPLPMNPSLGTSYAAGDVNGDGATDLVVAHVARQNGLLLGDGNGSFVLKDLPAIPINNSASAALGDVDGDGHLDVWFANFGPVGNPAAGQDRLLLGDGLGGFVETAGKLPAESVKGRQVVFGDVDNDGDLDAAVSGSSEYGGTQPVSGLMVNDGTGAFASSAKLASWALYLTDTLLSDFDGDGDLDLYGDGIFRNDGSGAFRDIPGALPFVPSLKKADVDAGDVDGDGDVDLLAAYETASVLRNDGTGVFSQAPAALPPLQHLAFGCALADLDGDGDLDVLLRQYDSPGGGTDPAPDALFVNDGAGAFQDASDRLPTGATNPYGVLAIDVDGDLDLDLVLADETTRLYRSDGVHFTEVTSPLVGFESASDVELGDLDGDGDLDAVALSWPTGYAWLNDGNGVLLGAGAFPAEQEKAVLGDLDGDGALDVFAFAGFAHAVYLGDGAGGFTPGVSIPTTAGWSEDATLADVDGDGDLDAICARSGGASDFPNQLFLGDGLGGLVDASSSLPAIDNASLGVAAGDVDQDGDVDLFFANWGVNDLHLGDGAGHFTDAPSLVPQIDLPTTSVGLADVDGDGDLDAVLGNGLVDFPFGTPEVQNQLMLGDGTGAFADAPSQVPSFAGATQSLAIGDADGDGDLDVCFANASPTTYSGAPLEYWRNDGSGTFALGAAATADARPAAIAMGDLDGDGDDDALLATDETIGVRQLSGLGRHTASRAVPNVAKPLVMDVFGDPSALWLLASAAQPAQIPFGAFGTIGIDVAKVVTIDSGVLDANGRAAQSFQVPSTPALIGASLWWQSLVGTPERFTNVEQTLFGDL